MKEQIKGDPIQLEGTIQNAQIWYERTLLPLVVYWDPERGEYNYGLAIADMTGKEVVAQIPEPIRCDGGEGP